MVKFGGGRKEGGRSKKTPLIAFATALMSYSALTGVALAEVAAVSTLRPSRKNTSMSTTTTIIDSPRVL